jgi:hypothetical protein
MIVFLRLCAKDEPTAFRQNQLHCCEIGGGKIQGGKTRGAGEEDVK